MLAILKKERSLSQFIRDVSSWMKDIFIQFYRQIPIVFRFWKKGCDSKGTRKARAAKHWIKFSKIPLIFRPFRHGWQKLWELIILSRRKSDSFPGFLNSMASFLAVSGEKPPRLYEHLLQLTSLTTSKAGSFVRWVPKMLRDQKSLSGATWVNHCHGSRINRIANVQSHL